MKTLAQALQGSKGQILGLKLTFSKIKLFRSLNSRCRGSSNTLAFVLIQRIIYISNERIVFIQRITYILNGRAIFIQPIIYVSNGERTIFYMFNDSDVFLLVFKIQG